MNMTYEGMNYIGFHLCVLIFLCLLLVLMFWMVVVNLTSD